MSEDNKQTVRSGLDAAAWDIDLRGVAKDSIYHGHVQRALTALDNLIDPAAIIEQLEGMKQPIDEASGTHFKAFQESHNAAIDAVTEMITKLAKGEG